MLSSRVRGIRTRFVWGSSLMTNEVGPMLWGRFLPEALSEGRYVTAPRSGIVGTRFESIQPASSWSLGDKVRGHALTRADHLGS